MHTSYFLFVMVITMFCYAVIKGRPSKLRQSNTEFCSEKVSLCNNKILTLIRKQKTSLSTQCRLVFLISGDVDLIPFQRDMGVSLWTVQTGATKYMYVLCRFSDFSPTEVDYCSSVSAVMQLLCHNSDVTCTILYEALTRWH